MVILWAHDVGIDTKLLFLGVGGILLALIAFVLSRRAEKLVGIPVMTGYGEDHERAMMEGTWKVSVITDILTSTSSLNSKRLQYPTTPFVVETQRPFVIIPTCCYEELKNISQEKATLWEIQKKEMGAEFTGIFQHNAEVALALKADLNRNLASTLCQVQEKISWVFEKELGHSTDWKTFRLHQFAVLIVSRLVAGVFVAPRFTRDDEWTKLSLALAVDLVLARDAIKRWPTFLQPLAGPFLSEIRTANRNISRMAEMLRPVIDSCLSENSATTRSLYDEKRTALEAQDGEDGGSFMLWIIKRLKTADPQVLARAQVSRKYIHLRCP